MGEVQKVRHEIPEAIFMNQFQGHLWDDALKSTNKAMEMMKNDISFIDGAQLKDEGIKQVSQHNENWLEDCVQFAIGHFVLTNDDFTGEDIRFYCDSRIGNPKHPNAWGALINALLKRKIIVPTGEYRPMKDRASHARRTPVYRRV